MSNVGGFAIILCLSPTYLQGIIVAILVNKLFK